MHGLLQPLSVPTLTELIAGLLRRVTAVSRAAFPRHHVPPRGIATHASGAERSGGGRVSLVGAGPGDPELLTLKALRALQEADVILHDQLVSDAVLALARSRTERINVGKKGYGRACNQSAINDLMIALASAGRRVIRLKAGDPLMFGRLEEEVAALEFAGIPFDLIPGISAAQGAASRLEVAVDAPQGRAALSGDHRPRRRWTIADDFDWAGLADPKATTAVYMPKATIGDLCAELLVRGLSPHHPALAVFNATRADEVALSATLATLPEAIAGIEGEAPCIVLIGDAVSRRGSASLARQEIDCPARV